MIEKMITKKMSLKINFLLFEDKQIVFSLFEDKKNFKFGGV